ncbi:membrane fusion protein, multidrug efflux system [Flavobacterium fryxellicola]|uniref:Secretion protein HlyD n=1 Tax=Flavobacterium fryxellicola TaxID=249352 RepID=A0A167YAR2_9FLAO|nr:HlyD family secretion protein [Flavobacterium fryxellicola]OAB29193.1 secretion protein HlyD [Flavobacterium fryxellicola]SHN57651.1 membrane fusion protein, multidrug efflux system [Flavobacterium fryxellicola]
MIKIENSSRAHKSFSKLITVIATVLVVMGIVLGIWFYFFNRNHEETNDAQVDQYVTPILTRITGYVQEVRYNENQFVYQGDTLIVLDNREYKSHLNSALAEVENAKANVNVIEKNVATTSNAILVRRSQLEAAKSKVWQTKLEYNRYQSLLKQEATTNQQVEKVKADYQSAQAQYQEISNTIQSATLNTTEASAKIPTAQTVITAKQATADNAALFLSYTVITAPYDGWVGKKMIQPGQLLKEGQVLVSIVSKEKWITANFKETQIQYLSMGQEVTLKADAISGRKFIGTIESISPASGARFSLLPPDNATGNFIKIEQRIPVRIRLQGPADQTAFLRAGMNVIVVAEHQ